MDVQTLKRSLDGLPVPDARYFDVISSTNDEALHWVSAGARDGCLVVADQQTNGRGRLGRRWVTRPESALALSLIIIPSPAEREHLGLFSPLGALAISEALEKTLDLRPQIKWPNDVLLARQKAAGILVEAAWLGETLQGVIVGIGVNVRPEAVPPADEVIFPATSVEQAAGHPVDRWKLLHAILRGLFDWRAKIGSTAFLENWERRLAFRDEWVRITDTSLPAGEGVTGQVVGIDPTGSLVLRTQEGNLIPVNVGDVQLRPV
jgi:BirA family transcriptional regulator, biotin operon repressor / biotin---[acetyl-CoA-carboxylase] ligase